MVNLCQFLPPQLVKSILVWNANKVSPRVTPTVMPTAIKMASASKWAHRVPSIKPSAPVKIPKKIKFVGNFLRTPSQHAMAIRHTKVIANATQYNQLECRAYCLKGW